jgi:broad specificity phosphatase PhoE/adenylate kinase family enzyme
MEIFPKNKIVIGIVGLPGRGKTYIAKKIARYINWIGYKSEVFNTCEYRRDLYADKSFTADFFHPHNAEAVNIHKDCSDRAVSDLINYLNESGDVAILDGTNESVEQRREIKRTLDESLSSYSLLWVESICNDENVLNDSIQTLSSSCPDYKDSDINTAIEDFKKRIENCRIHYQELSKEEDGNETSFIKLYNFGSQVLLNNVSGYLESKIMSLLMNIHNKPRPIYFSRHGESMYNTENKVGGDPDLSQRGYQYAANLNVFLQGEMKDRRINKNSKFFSSTLQRTIITAGAVDIGIKATPLKRLDEISTGAYDGLTYAEIEEKYPRDAEERKKDKLRYRYPEGESYMDIIQRVEPVIFAIEKSKEPVIIVAHQAVIRCLYAYFCKFELEEVPHLSVNLHTVIKLIPDDYHVHEYKYNLERTQQPVPTYHKRLF